jgi:hypothetical protein
MKKSIDFNDTRDSRFSKRNQIDPSEYAPGCSRKDPTSPALSGGSMIKVLMICLRFQWVEFELRELQNKPTWSARVRIHATRVSGFVNLGMVQESGDQPTTPHSDSDSSASLDELRHSRRCRATVTNLHAVPRGFSHSHYFNVDSKTPLHVFYEENTCM